MSEIKDKANSYTGTMNRTQGWFVPLVSLQGKEKCLTSLSLNEKFCQKPVACGEQDT